MAERSGCTQPSFDEVKRFAVEEGLANKISVSKFYDYYSKSNFLFRGIPMDWKAKMREWAESERPKKRQTQSAADYSFKHDPKYLTKEYLDGLLERI